MQVLLSGFLFRPDVFRTGPLAIRRYRAIGDSFRLAIPIQIVIGVLVITPTLSVAMMWFLGGFENRFQGILLPELN